LRNDPEWQDVRKELHYQVEQNATKTLFGSTAGENEQQLVRGLTTADIEGFTETRTAMSYIESHPPAKEAYDKFVEEFGNAWRNGMDQDKLMDATGAGCQRITEAFKDSTAGMENDPEAVQAVAFAAADKIAESVLGTDSKDARILRDSIAEALVTSGGIEFKSADVNGEEDGRTTVAKDEFAGRQELIQAIWEYNISSGGRTPNEQAENEIEYMRSTEPDYLEDSAILYDLKNSIEQEYEYRSAGRGVEGSALQYLGDMPEYQVQRTMLADQEPRDVAILVAHGF
jgi:hypothetical protein